MKNKIFGLYYNSHIFVEIPLRLSDNPLTNKEVVDTLASAQAFFNGHGLSSYVTVYAVHGNQDFSYSPIASSNGTIQNFPHIYTDIDLGLSKERDLIFLAENPGKIPKAVLKDSLLKILEWARKVLPKHKPEEYPDNLEDMVEGDLSNIRH